MVNPGWSRPESPFHAGELAIQTRLGTQAQIDKQARQFIRDYLPDQHRQFFAQLPHLIVGTVDATGNPWASILVGQPGFISSPDDRTLRIAAKPLPGDPLKATLTAGIDIGLLGIELHTRRRNRMNGVVTRVDSEGIEVHVGQSFGNCPKYIQARQFEWRESDSTASKSLATLSTLSEADQAMITHADTLFIATANPNPAAGAAKGVDISHRGGKPGFVRLDGHRLTVPDFAGNGMFNTFGNLEVNDRAGLLFIDFDRGNLLYLTGTAEVIWDGAEIQTYAGAERLFRFYFAAGYRTEGTLPLRWSTPKFSPFLSATGSW